MGVIYTVYDQLAQLIARIDPKLILELRADVQTQQRMDELLAKNENQLLSDQEKDELDHFIVLERLFRLAKMRADGLKRPDTL